MSEPVECECGRFAWHDGNDGVGFWHTAGGHIAEGSFCDECGTKLNDNGTCGLSYAELEAERDRWKLDAEAYDAMNDLWVAADERGMRLALYLFPRKDLHNGEVEDGHVYCCIGNGDTTIADGSGADVEDAIASCAESLAATATEEGTGD